MRSLAFLAHLTGIAVEPLPIAARRVELRVAATEARPAGPPCRHPSARVRSLYERRVADVRLIPRSSATCPYGFVMSA